MNLIIGKWCFRPGPILSMLALSFFSLFVSLGLWQLNRAEYKRTLHEMFLSRQTEPPADLSNINDYQAYLWRSVLISGRFADNEQLLLDNQVVKGEPGYFVYTPFQLDSSNLWVLVNRGWVAAGMDRRQAPRLKKTRSDIMLKGLIKEAPKTGMLLQETPPEKMTKDIIRVQKIDLKQLSGLLDKELLPVIVRLQADAEGGYVRDWSESDSGEAVHLGYAFQWFAFAVTLLIIYLAMNIKKID